MTSGRAPAADSVVRMANQIARNYEHRGDDAAAAAVAAHLRDFWTPSMRAELDRILETSPDRLNPVALRAAQALSADG